MLEHIATPFQTIEVSLGGLPPKGGVQGGKGGRGRGSAEVQKGGGGLREALETLVSRGALVVGGCADSFSLYRNVFRGFTP